MTTDRRDGGAAAPRELARVAYHALHYNQDLVQFVDSKASTLILVNSLFIAATTGVAPGLAFLRVASVLTSAAAVAACLAVVMTRSGDGRGPSQSQDLFFFADIRRRRSPGQYAIEFAARDERVLAEEILRRTWTVAGIAQSKFEWYRWAQAATAAAGALWLLVHLANVAA